MSDPAATRESSWRLLDAAARAEISGLRVPDVQARSWLLPGDTVKIGFEHAHVLNRGERLWVTVTDRLAGDRYRGEIVNDPQLLPYTRGDGVTFAPDHVLEIYDDQD